MSREKFDFLLSQVAPSLKRRHYTSSIRPNISPAEKLTLTLRFLAAGVSQASLSFSFTISSASVCNIVYETCEAIWSALQPMYVTAPTSKEDWLKISKEFEQLWNFPHCIGAIDGKHVVIQAPPNAGSEYYNYKGTHSIVLLAVCDARYSDGGIFSNCSFGQALEANSLFLPDPSPLPNDTSRHPLPYVIVGDEAFPLKSYLLRPFPGRYLPEDQAIFNYRLSRARRIIENTFGILAARWRIFRNPINAHPNRAEVFTKVAIALHNFLQTSESSTYCPTGFVDVHFINKEWEPKSRRLQTMFMPKDHTGSNISEPLTQAMHQWEHNSSSVVCITTEYGFNIILAFDI
uniref:DDE Tnp4 domain-containing protein n=1 Tax=Amphimedon queenslandica TaxID=400682 RepID=A0A1X7VAV4_AMPQE